MQDLPDWNAVRFDSLSPRGHVESYFVKANDARGRRALWLNATIYASLHRPAHAVAEAWAIVFDREHEHVAVKDTVPIAEASFCSDALNVRVGDRLWLAPTETRGDITQGEHKISWSLRMEGDTRPLVMLPHPSMYAAPFPKLKLVSPMPDLRFEGTLTVDGRRTKVTAWRGMQGHSWGRGHADLYAWGHCNRWDQSEDVVVEAVSARMKVGPVLTPTMTIVRVRHEGHDLPLATPAGLLRNRGEIHARRWFFRARHAGAMVEGDFSAQTEDFAGLYYPDPNGHMTYCLNSKLANGRVRIDLPGREPLELTTRCAALELGTRDPIHGVRMMA
jgi:hypothetical protein